MNECEGFDRTVNWTFDEWKHVWKTRPTEFDLNTVSLKPNQIQYMRSIQGHSGGERSNPRLQKQCVYHLLMFRLHLARGIIA